MKLRKSIVGPRGVFRIFESAWNVFHVLKEDGRTVDEFVVRSERSAEGAQVNVVVRQKRRARGVPDLAGKFSAELKDNRSRG